MYSGGANGSRPTSSAGGPVRASSNACCQIARRGLGQDRADEVDHAGIRRLRIGECQVQQLDPGAVLVHQSQAGLRSPGGEFADDGEVVGQFRRADREPGCSGRRG